MYRKYTKCFIETVSRNYYIRKMKKNHYENEKKIKKYHKREKVVLLIRHTFWY